MPSSEETECADAPETTPRCELEENLEALRGTDLFSAVPLDRLRLYAYMCRREHYRAGEFLFRQGEAATRGFVLLSGRVQIIREYPDKHVVLTRFGPGDFFGGIALLGDVNYVFSARAVEDCEVVTLDRESFRKLLLQFPDQGILKGFSLFDLSSREFPLAFQSSSRPPLGAKYGTIPFYDRGDYPVMGCIFHSPR